MALLLFKDTGLLEPLGKISLGEREVYRFELPRNTPGGVSRSSFIIYNDSPNQVENVQILHDNPQVDFHYEDMILPKSSNKVAVEWRAPLTFKEALVLMFQIEAEEIVTPRI